MKASVDSQKGSTELVVLGLLAALIVVLAIPLLGDVSPEHMKQPVGVAVHQPAPEANK